jgi:predicted nucleic acid-binding protein
VSVVIDANITAALFIKLPYSLHSERLFRIWHNQGVEIFAPAPWPAEVVSALVKMISVGQISSDDARLALASLEHFSIQVILPDSGLLDRSFLWASRLGQIVAYDAQYLTLAESLQAEFWTADRRLFTTLERLNISWAHWVGEVDQG